MQSMSDQELDNLFKEAAEGFTPQQDENAWKQMASMLDQHAVKTAGFWNPKIISGAAFIALITITGIWYVSTNNQKAQTKPGENRGGDHATQGAIEKQKEHAIAVGPHTPDKENPVSAESPEGKNNRTRAAGGNAGNTSSEAVNRHTVAGDHDRAGKSDASVLVAETYESSGVHDHQAKEEHSPDLRSLHSQAEREAAADSVQPQVTKKEDIDSAARVSETPDNKEDEIRTGSGFSLKAVVSPDFSSIKFFSAGKPGINYGLMGGYSFNSRWSVFTGVIYSKKLYSSTDIEDSYNSSGHDYPVKEIEGDCRIFDIPVNVYYTFFPGRNFSIRAGLGFSSYIMRKEDYVYCVDNYGTDVYYEQKIRGKNNEWFKMMNFSVAVSKKLSPRLSAEFEPFVKAPLAGVGEGKVALVSMGAFINLRFDLMNSK